MKKRAWRRAVGPTLLAVLTAASGTALHGQLESDRIRALAESMESGRKRALVEFWRELEEQGTPLVEAIPEEPGYSRVTFVWRGDEETENVLLVASVDGGTGPENRTLFRLTGTDVWYRTYRLRNDYRSSYVFSPNDPLRPPADSTEAAARAAGLRADPLNPKRFSLERSLLELPDAPPEPWIVRHEGVPQGEEVWYRDLHSDVLENERDVLVYLPPGYEEGAGREYPLLLLFDLRAYTTAVPTPVILDNLVAAGRLPPLVAVFVGNVHGQRSNELACNERFARFLADELLPKVRREVSVTTDPSRVVIGGSSFGGLAAACFAYRSPDLVGNVLSQSGSYWWAPGYSFRDPDPESEGEWLTRQLAKAARRPIRWYLEVGLHEGEGMLSANRHFRTVLEAKGYEIVAYREAEGGHDYAVWRGSLAVGLEALFGDIE